MSIVPSRGWGRRRAQLALAAALAAAVPGLSPLNLAVAVAAEESEVEQLRREVADLRRRDDENRRRMEQMEGMLRRLLDGDPAASASPAASSSPAGAKTTGGAGAVAGGAPAPAPSASAALDAALASSSSAAPSSSPAGIWSAPIGSTGAQARLMDISLTTNAAAGGSTASDAELGDLQGGAHDPLENGFTLQQAELALGGAVDPFFTGFANIVFTPDFIELEEGFLTTSSLPFGLQVEGGYFLTEFGLINPTHAHAWYWLDQPIVNTRMFGGEGLRSPGLRASWLLPLPFFAEAHVGVQDADFGEYTQSFIGEGGVGGRPNVDQSVDSAGDFLWLGRLNAAWDVAEQSALLLGASVLHGPNGTGPNGDTWIWGADMKLRWRSPQNFRGWPFVVWQTEVIGRDYDAAYYVGGTASGGDDDGHGHGAHARARRDADGEDDHDDHDDHEDEEESEFPDDLAADTLHDLGFYTQLLYGFRYRWAAGFRAEYATGSGQSVEEGVLASRADDPLRADRLRLSPLLLFHPTEFSRLRLQYNYDDSDALGGGDAHTVWVGAEILYGTHGAHKY